MAKRPASWSNPSPATGRRVPARVWKTLGVLAGLAGCVAAITYVVLWLTPPTAPRLIVATAGYDDNLPLPANTTATTDGRLLTELARPGRARLRPDPAPYRLSRGEAGRVLDELARARTPTVVAVFAANGGCDASGPYLIPDDANVEPGERIRVKAILDAAAKLPADTRKLLVFDTANTSASVLGQFHNDFARGVQSLEPDITAVPNLLVFFSAGVNQQSWRSPEWGESVFLHHLRTGLAGGADANGDSRLSADELIDFTTRQTRTWARDQRAALQVPEVLPTADTRHRDMFLGVVEKPTTLDPLPATFAPPPAWEAMWAHFAELDKSTPHPAAFAPQLWREYTGWVMRSDCALADGNDTASVKAADAAEQVRLKILAARVVHVSSQTLALLAALGQHSADAVPPAVVAKVAQATAADRPAEWEKAKADRLAFGRALVSWVADDPFARLRLAPPVVALVVEGWNVVPAELHFLTMLARDLPDHPATAAVWPLVKRVLRLRLLAEQTATGADGEAVRPWIADDLRTADSERRDAEDLGFATDADSWSTVGDLAQNAERYYGKAATTADVVRTARHTWHTSAFRLKGLTEWLAAGEHPKDLLGRMTREEWLTVVRTTWADNHRLGEWVNGPPTADRVESLKTLAKSVADRVSEVQSLHRAAVARLLDTRPGDESREQLAKWWHAADMALSVPFAERRKELLTEHRRASRQLHVLARTRPEPLAEPTADEVRERAFAAARRRGLLHLSALGREAYTRAAGDDFDRTTFQIDQFSRQADAPAELIAAGERFAAAVRQLSTTIPTDDANLPTADRLARASLLTLTTDPAIRLRTLRAEQLLLWQADRTTTDRWSGGDTAKPYYRHAADVLRDDARKLAGRPALPPTPATPYPFTVTAPTDIAVTDEPDPRVTFTLAPSEGVAGFVTYSGGGGRFVRGPDREGAPPDPITLAVPARTGPIPTAPTVEASVLTLRGYFRGETADTKVNVSRHPLPHTTAIRRPADNAVSVAVRPSPDVRAKFGTGGGHLHFVIDCSGSMADGGFTTACDRLEGVLNAVPAGVTVAVSAFGQKSPDAKTPEDTFATLRPAAVWDCDAHIADVMARVRELTPWDKSAVTRSVLKARASVPDVSPRAVILFSDCADNRFADADVNPKKLSVKEALRAAFGDGCPLHVVAFPAEKAADGVRDEYRTVTTFKPAGLFLSPDQTGRLRDWIRTATAPQVRLKLVNEGGTADDLATGTDAADNWLSPLPPGGNFTLRSPAVKLDRPLNLRAGERLLLGLSAGKDGPRFTRPNYAADVPAVARLKGSDWAVAVPRQRLTDAVGLELVALADRKEDDAKVLSPARIADVWFELAPSTKSAVAVKWANSTGWPCPAWDITCPAWPADDGGAAAVPTLSAWWSADRPFPACGTWALPTDDRLPSPASVPTTAGEVTVNGLSVESHGGRSCLVVRLTNPAGSPIVPRVKGATPDGTEVRCYRDANRVTALFWWADAAAMKKATALEFVAIAEAKKAAVAAGTLAELPALPPPAAGTPAPTPAPR